jgi:pimeloyl-ACP methyl ester carboxylesterase
VKARAFLVLAAALCVGCGHADSAAGPAAWHARTISVGGGDSLHLVYTRLGSSRVLVFVPGLADTWASYQKLADALPDTFGMILVDALGHGSSTKAAGASGPARQSMAVRAALDSLGVEPFAVIGHSYGGLIAQHYALRTPDLPAVVLISTLATLQGSPSADSWAAFGRSVPDTVPDEVLAGQARSFHAEVPDSVVRPYIEAARGTPGHVWREVIAALVSEDIRPQLASWKPRTLLIIPENDKVLGEGPMQGLAAAIAHAEVARIARTSHAPHWERADTVAHVVEQFLSSVDLRTEAPQDARERAFVAAARTVVAFLRGDAEFRALQLADTVVFHLAPESGGGVAHAAADDLRERAAWRVRSQAGHTYVLVPPALPRLTTRFGRHLKCFEYDLAGVVPQLAWLPHVGAMLGPVDSTSCLQTWNFTFVFEADAWPPRLIAVVYDQWEW